MWIPWWPSPKTASSKLKSDPNQNFGFVGSTPNSNQWSYYYPGSGNATGLNNSWQPSACGAVDKPTLMDDMSKSGLGAILPNSGNNMTTEEFRRPNSGSANPAPAGNPAPAIDYPGVKVPPQNTPPAIMPGVRLNGPAAGQLPQQTAGATCPAQDPDTTNTINQFKISDANWKGLPPPMQPRPACQCQDIYQQITAIDQDSAALIQQGEGILQAMNSCRLPAENLAKAKQRLADITDHLHKNRFQRNSLVANYQARMSGASPR